MHKTAIFPLKFARLRRGLDCSAPPPFGRLGMSKFQRTIFFARLSGAVCVFSLRSVFVLFHHRIFRKKAEGRRVARIRIRSRIVRIQVERTRTRTIVSATASRADTKAF